VAGHQDGQDRGPPAPPGRLADGRGDLRSGGRRPARPDRLEALFEVGIDEVSWRKGHRYLTLVTDHRSGKVVWGAEGKDTATCDQFFAELDADRAAKLTAVSIDRERPT